MTILSTIIFTCSELCNFQTKIGTMKSICLHKSYQSLQPSHFLITALFYWKFLAKNKFQSPLAFELIYIKYNFLLKRFIFKTRCHQKWLMNVRPDPVCDTLHHMIWCNHSMSSMNPTVPPSRSCSRTGPCNRHSSFRTTGFCRHNTTRTWYLQK